MKNIVNADHMDKFTIEDEPREIYFNLIFEKMKHHWKFGIFIVLACGLLSMILSPSTGFSGYAAETTLYTPASTERKVDDRIFIISNDLSQLGNVVELIQSKVYREAVAREIGTDDLNEFGSFAVNRLDKTDLISIKATAQSKENAEKLCTAIVRVMTEQIGKKVSVHDMVPVDSVKSYSVSTPSDLGGSFMKGCGWGAVIWMIYVLFKTFGDKKYRSSEEVEKDLNLPVITVLPSTDSK